ncbi:NAD(P)/FAD-dependent oxidoreductase [Dongia rigui]|uniref:FAD-dependent oxidoreductase n=1 Tax=Dongia rigui TaxID=940149 RepID=A0ABU5E0Z2_9PROT|nr:FAD-dependent oxidoreductase [Dongia rigui]MDY0872962.1 FAD-dependent oxidoreductase [Dongia rigui]
MKTHDVIILGAGPAGLSAAAELKRLGHRDIVILDRESQGGGIPRHCGHTGYGLLQFGRLMTGPDFARRLVDQVSDLDLRLGHTVLKLEPNGRIQTTGPNGPETFQAQKILLAFGARETPRSARLISGTRPWGVMNTGALQQFAYLHGKAPFQRPIIIGTELVAFSSLLTLGHVGVKAVAMLEPRDRITAWRPGDWVARIAFGVPVLTGCSDLTILGQSRVEGVSFKRHGRERVLEGDGIIFTGQFRPETGLLTQSHLELDPGTRGPVIDQLYRCTDASYFAAGNLLRGIETAGQCYREGKSAAHAIHAALTGAAPVSTAPIRIEATGALSYVYPQRLTGRGPYDPLLFKARAGEAVKGTLRVLADGREIWSRPINVLPERRIAWRVPAVDLSNTHHLTIDLTPRS